MKNTEKTENYPITAGKFAALCGTTRDVLRYYDKMGILVPRRDAENNYRYYSSSQVTSFYFINTLRKLGCPASEIKKYITSGGSIRSLLEYRRQALLDLRSELDHSLATLNGALSLIDRVSSRQNGEVFEDVSETGVRLRVTPVQSPRARHASDMTADLNRHITDCRREEKLQVFPLGAAIDRDSFIKGEYIYKYIFSYADGQFPDGEKVLVFPGGRTVGCVQRGQDGDTEEAYRAVTEYIEKEGLRLRSDVFYLNIINVVSVPEQSRYLKYVYAFVE